MTLSNVRTQILSHFINNDIFLISDSAKIKTEKELEKLKVSLVSEAMKDLEANKIVKKITDDEGVERGWILESKLGAHGQDVYISLPISDMISHTINSYIEANGMKEELSNSLNITERDIIALIGIINDALNDEAQ